MEGTDEAPNFFRVMSANVDNWNRSVPNPHRIVGTRKIFICFVLRGPEYNYLMGVVPTKGVQLHALFEGVT